MKIRGAAIVTLLIGTLMVCWMMPAIAANNDDLSRLLTTSSCSGCDFSGATLIEANLPNADLSHANLNSSDLTKAILKASDLSHTNLQGARLQNADLSNANLSGADLSNAKLNDAILSNAELAGANLSNTELKGARFWGFAGFANLSSANLSGANLQGADLSNIKLLDTNLTDADLSNGANLHNALLNGAILSGANLAQANLVNAHLNHANLQSAKLTSANFRKANLTGADLTGADLGEINLVDAVLTDTLGLDPYAEQLIQKATTAANSQDYLGAIAYLSQVPLQTQFYSQAKIQTAKYQEEQRIKEQQKVDLEAEQLLQTASVAAQSDGYPKAIRTLNRVPKNSASYAKAQEKIAFYTEKQQLKEQAEQAARETERTEREQQVAEAQIREATLSIGVSRNAIQSLFEKSGVDFQFSQSQPVDGQPRVFGKSRDGLTLIELIGSPSNLRKATIMTALSENNLVTAAYLVAFIKKTSPEWSGSGEWLQDNAALISQGSEDEAVTTYGNQKIKFDLLKSIGTLMVSVEANI